MTFGMSNLPEDHGNQPVYAQCQCEPFRRSGFAAESSEEEEAGENEGDYRGSSRTDEAEHYGSAALAKADELNCKPAHRLPTHQRLGQ